MPVMLYLWLKWIHIISSTFLFGAGAATALMIFRGYLLFRKGSREGKLTITGETLSYILGHAVFADWIFTLSAGVVQLITGVVLTYILQLPLFSGWIFQSLLLFILAFITWAPAAWIQKRMHTLTSSSSPEERKLDQLIDTLLTGLYWVFPPFYPWFSYFT